MASLTGMFSAQVHDSFKIEEMPELTAKPQSVSEKAEWPSILRQLTDEKAERDPRLTPPGRNVLVLANSPWSATPANPSSLAPRV
jgi:hypothetical protein